MSSAIDFLERMLAAGMPLDMAMTAARAFEQEVKVTAEQLLEDRRAKSRESSRRHREKKEAVTAVTSPASPDVTEVTPPETKVSPTPPSKTQPLKGLYNTTRARDAAFNEFWAAYPKRKAKDAARKAFDRALDRIPGDALATILAGIERAMPGWDDPKFIPHPASWLNAGCWDDDPPAPRTLSPRQANDRQPSADAKHEARQANLARALGAIDALAERQPEPPGGRWDHPL